MWCIDPLGLHVRSFDGPLVRGGRQSGGCIDSDADQHDRLKCTIVAIAHIRYGCHDDQATPDGGVQSKAAARASQAQGPRKQRQSLETRKF